MPTSDGHSHAGLPGNGIPEAPPNRSFAFLLAGICGLIGGINLWSGGASAPIWLASGAVLAIVGQFRPAILTPLTRIWLRIGDLMHRIVNPVILTVLFFGAFVPTGLLLRLTGRDPLRLKLDPTAETYWIERTPPGPAPDSMKRQF